MVRWLPLIERWTPDFPELDPIWILGIIAQESQGFPELMADDLWGSTGLMQVGPRSWTGTRTQLLRPPYNIYVGMRMFSATLEKSENDMRRALGAYNCGFVGLDANRCGSKGGYAYADRIIDYWIPVFRSELATAVQEQQSPTATIEWAATPKATKTITPTITITPEPTATLTPTRVSTILEDGVAIVNPPTEQEEVMLLKSFWNRTTLVVGSILTALMLSAFTLLQQVSERTEELIGLIAALVLGALGAKPINWLKDKFGVSGGTALLVVYVSSGVVAVVALAIAGQFTGLEFTFEGIVAFGSVFFAASQAAYRRLK